MAKILLVEDDNNLREIYGARLTAEGYEIVSAPDGEEALAIAVKEKPDLIITDVMMPKISGFDMLDILRNAPETKDTKVIMMTALSQAEDKERADKLGADLYLVKSQVTLEDVAASVRKILGDEVPVPQTPAAPAPAADSPAPPAPQAPPTPQPAPVPIEAPVPPATPAVEVPAPAVAAPQQEGTKEVSAQPAAPAPAVPGPPQTTPPQSNTLAAAEPAVQTPPAPPVPEPQPVPAPAPAVVPPAPTPKKIEVILPDDTNEEPAKDNKPAAPAEAPPEPVQSNQTDDSASPIGPNLAEALAEEEKTIQGQITDFEKKPATEPSGTEAVSSVIKPQAQVPEPVETAPTPPPVLSNSETGNKVIQPLNDPTKAPDLNSLLAQEEAKEASANAAGPGTGIKPTPTDANPENNGQSPDHPDDFSKISL